MTSPRLAALMTAFRRLQRSMVSLPRRSKTLHELEGLADPEIGPFWRRSSVMLASNDLARIEALRILETRQFGDDQDRDKLARRILRVLLDDEGDQVRAYAARALSNFTDVSDVVAALGKHVLDGDEDDECAAQRLLRSRAKRCVRRGGRFPYKGVDSRRLPGGGSSRLARWHGLSK
jgi:hypothetical protein